MDDFILGEFYTKKEKCTSQIAVFNEIFTEVYEQNTTMR